MQLQQIVFSFNNLQNEFKAIMDNLFMIYFGFIKKYTNIRKKRLRSECNFDILEKK